MKRILLSLGALFFLFGASSNAQAQELSIAAVAADEGESVTVPVNARNLEDVGSFTLVIDYDASVLSYDSTSSAPENFSVSDNASDGELRIAAFSSTGEDPVTIQAGELISLHFTYNGGTTELTLTDETEVTTIDGSQISVDLSGGVVADEVSEVSLGDVEASASGETVSVPISVSPALSNVGSVSLVIDFDTSVLSFSGVTNNTDLLAVEGNATVEDGQLKIGGYNTNGVELSGDVIMAEFTYQGGATALNFDTPNSSVTNTDGAKLPVTFVNGSVTGPDAELATLSLPTISARAGEQVLIPVQASNLSNVGSVSLEITYDSDVLSFDEGASEINAEFGSGSSLNLQDPGVIRFGGADTGGLDLEDNTIVTLAFNLDAEGGSSALTFNTENSEVTDTGANPFNVRFQNGQVNALQVLTIAEARQQEPGEEVAVEGVVTRAMGRIFRMQDPTAGIAVFRPNESFVADEGIEKGDSLRVIGERDDFNGLQEIIPDTIITLTEDAVVPSAQAVTVPELLQNGERYESELVELDYLETNTEDDVFQANTSYTVDNNQGDEITLRVQQESDTEIPGMAVPNAFQYEGVVGEFNGDYQLIPVDSTDITHVVSSEPGPTAPEEFVLRGNYPNPLQGQTTISLDLPKAANVSVEVVNALGQRVKRVTEEGMSPGAKQALQLEGLDLPSGVYLYRVVAETGNETWTRSGKMTVVK